MRWCSSCSELMLCATLALAACRPDPQRGAALQITIAPADRDADVWVDGNYIGRVGELQAAGAGPLRLAPGRHRVEVRKPGRFPVQRTIVVDGKDATVVLPAELLADPQ
ncbi:MAG: hypothetical protein K1X88_30485 [Nannocystaceae bacterium]|nr:hypothetical protein [Nannocystaceae bacterium]